MPLYINKTFFFLFFAIVCVASAGAATPKVVASSPPVYAIVAAVTGEDDVALLAGGHASFHHASLKPSMRRLAGNADVFFYGDADMEPLAKALLPTLPDRVTSFSLRNDAGTVGDNPHFWMNPQNVLAAASFVRQELVARFPNKADRFTANYRAFKEKLAVLDADIIAMFANVKDAPFIAYHNAYQGLVDAYGLNMIDFVVSNPDAPPSARRIREVRHMIMDKKPVCLFVEKGEGDVPAASLAENTDIRIAYTNPDGSGMAVNQDLYLRLMRKLARNIADCLGS